MGECVDGRLDAVTRQFEYIYVRVRSVWIQCPYAKARVYRRAARHVISKGITAGKRQGQPEETRVLISIVIRRGRPIRLRHVGKGPDSEVPAPLVDNPLHAGCFVPIITSVMGFGLNILHHNIIAVNVATLQPRISDSDRSDGGSMPGDDKFLRALRLDSSRGPFCFG
jgi:hypothetical protein